MPQSEEIKSKLDIVEVIREYAPVKAVGANFQALCPFHNEKTPSFVISPEKQIWHCFGCGRGGDVFSFVMEKEGLGFVETLRLLAPKAGVVLKYERPEEYSERNRLLDILELAGKYYAHVLTLPVGREAKEYLDRRGLSAETIIDWQLGYSPGTWDSLYKFLRARPLNGKKFTDEEIFLAGLISKKDSSGVGAGRRGYYDRFRDRIMFPIWDAHNNLIAFTARVNPAKEKTEKMGKYINCPETKVYDKSRVLFALNKAKSAIKEADLAIVVEGQMDAITCHQHGFKNVVASSGTALTTGQVSLLKRFTNNIALLFDMDAAGQMAADRGIKEVLAQELNLKIIVLESGKDPDECLRNNPGEFNAAVNGAKPMLEYYFAKVSAGLDLSQLENKQAVVKKMLGMIALVHNKLEQDFWLKKLSAAVNIQEIILRENLEKIKSSDSAIKNKEMAARNIVLKVEAGHFTAKGMDAQLTVASRENKLAELLLALLVKFPEFINYSSSNLEPEYLQVGDLSRFYKELIIYYNKFISLDYENFHLYLEESGRENDRSADAEKLLEKLILLGEKDFYNYESGQVKTEIINIITELKKYGRQRRIHALQKAIAAAETNGREEELSELMNKLKNLMLGD